MLLRYLLMERGSRQSGLNLRMLVDFVMGHRVILMIRITRLGKIAGATFGLRVLSHGMPQQVHPVARLGTHKNSLNFIIFITFDCRGQPALVDLVPDQNLRNMIRTNFAQYGIDLFSPHQPHAAVDRHEWFLQA